MIKASNGFVVVEVINENKGIVVYQHEKQEALKGLVISVGGNGMEYGSELTAPCVKGDKILHTTIGFETYKDEKKEYHIVPFRNIIAIFE